MQGFRLWVAVLAVTLIAGCTPAHVRPKLAVIAEGERFPAINLYINTGDFVTAEHAQLIRYLGGSIRESGRFARVDVGMLRWPFTLQVTYNWERRESVGTFAAGMASAATLLIVPAPIVEAHTYKFELSLGTEVIRVFEYEDPTKSSVSLFSFGKLQSERQRGIDRIIQQFFSDLESSGALPLEKDVAGKKAAANVAT